MATGLINTDPNKVSTYEAAKTTTVPWEVTTDQTVQGQVKSIIDENSPLQQQAATRALQQANKRGLINSSMAVQAGQAATYEAALPIATADAATYGKAAGYNADQTNQANLQNANFQNQASQFNAAAANTRSNQEQEAETRKTLQGMQGTTQKELQEMQGQTQVQLQGMQGQTQKEVQQIQADTQVKLSQMDAQNKAALQTLQNENKVLIQSNSQAASLMNQATGVINNIMMNDKMDAAAKTEASRQVYENLRTQLQILGATASLDLSTLLGTNPYPDQQTQQAQEDAAKKNSILSDPDYAAMLADWKRQQQAQNAGLGGS